MTFAGSTSAKPVLQAFQSFGLGQLRKFMTDYFADVDMATQAFSSTAPKRFLLTAPLAKKLLAAQRQLSDGVYLWWDDAIVRLGGDARKARKKGRIGAKNQLAALEARIAHLSLVDEQQLEQMIMLGAVTKRLEMSHAMAISEFELRLEHLVCKKIGRTDNPLGPRLLGEALRASMATIGLSAEEADQALQSVLLTLDAAYGGMLDDVNAWLVASGVLPEIDAEETAFHVREVQREDATDEARKRLISEIAGVSDDSAPVSEKALYAGLSKLVNQAGEDKELAHHVLTTDKAKPVLSQEEVLALLNKVEVPPLRDSALGYVDAVADQVVLVEQVRDAAANAGKSVDDKTASSISMVSMLFDKLNHDQNLSGPISDLIGHLKVPMTKAAVLDDTFFSDTESPAQDLLNMLAKSAATWSPTRERRRDSLYNKIAAVVDRLNTEFVDDYAIFDDCARDFDLFQQAEKRRARLIEERLITAEKAKARTERARMVARSHVAEKFQVAQALPGDFDSFLQSTWQNVLFFIFNKMETTDCEEWRKAIALEDQMLAIFNRSAETEEGVLQSELRSQLATVGLDQFQIDSSLKRLIPTLQAPPSPVPVVDEAVLCATQAPADVATDAAVKTPAAAATTAQAVTKAPVASPPVPTPSAPAELPVASAPERAPERIPERVVEAVADEVTLSVQDLAHLEALAMGDWIAMPYNGEETKVRVAAYIRHTDTYVLVFRNGAKAGQYTRTEMRNLVAKGQVRFIESTMMFERTLESVIARLRQATLP